MRIRTLITTLVILLAGPGIAVAAEQQPCRSELPVVELTLGQGTDSIPLQIARFKDTGPHKASWLSTASGWCTKHGNVWSLTGDDSLQWFGVKLRNNTTRPMNRILSLESPGIEDARLQLLETGAGIAAPSEARAPVAIKHAPTSFALDIPAGRTLAVLLALHGESTFVTAHLQDVPSFMSANDDRSVIIALVMGALFCMLLFQVLLAAGTSEQRALTALVLSVFAYESVALGFVVLMFGQPGMVLVRYTVQFECLVLIAATFFAAAYFDLKLSHEKLHSLFQITYGIQGLMLLFSLVDTNIVSRAMQYIAVLPLGLIAATTAYKFRDAPASAAAFAAACLPTLVGAGISGAMAAGTIAWNPHYLFASDIGLLVSLLAFVIIVSRRLEQSRKRQETELSQTQRRYQLALEGANDGIVEWDMRSGAVLASQRAHEIMGIDYQAGWQPQSAWEQALPQSELDRISSMPEALVHDDVVRVETWRVDSQGNKRHMLVQGKLDFDRHGQPLRLIGSISDTSAQKRLEERLRHDALHDFLTGLPNRTLLADRIQRVVERLKRNPDSRAALLFVGIDNFKSINDNQGHSFGDQVLASLADRLVEFVRSSDTVARFGGDEFVVLLEDMFSMREAERFANRILAKIQTPMDIQTQQLIPSVSIGLALVEDPNVNVETVLGDADIAMFTAKEQGKGRVVTFETTMRTRAAKRLELESALHTAMENEELSLAYQPIFSLEGKAPRAVGVEALLRWNRSDRADIAPSDLLSLAEENGMIEEIGKWVIRRAARQLADWRAEGYPDDFYININLSPVHFESEEIVTTILKEVDPLGIPRNALRIEIVETAVIRHPEKALSVIKLLQSQGILVSIDDFGTGFSSLSYLHRFPFYALKIDRSFVQDIVESKATRDIITAIVVLARRLGIRVVAEGIENDSQLDFLCSVGCDLGQGFLLAKPADSVDRFFNSRLAVAERTPDTSEALAPAMAAEMTT